MALIHENITPIPATEPDAVPELWNTRYEEIDDNFENLDERLEEAEANVEGLDPDMQNAIYGVLMGAMDAAALANRELERWKNVRLQEGEITIVNRGIIAGCSVSASAGSARNLDLLKGKFFAHGRDFAADDAVGATAVASNNGATSSVCFAYLLLDENGDTQCNCTGLDEDVPANGIEVAMLTVPAGNNETTDPNLSNVSITDTRRLEPLWPMASQNPAWEYIPLEYVLPDSDYAVHIEVVSFEGGNQQLGDFLVQDRLNNGFKLFLTGAVDAVIIRYTVRRVKI
jgi:hypothetical protein